MIKGKEYLLNGICPYYTMFPLDFPLGILKRNAKRESTVLDPFCGRGTTNYAARLLGFRSVGVDSSPVAAAIAMAKLANTKPGNIIRAARAIIRDTAEYDVPVGGFWESAFHPEVLDIICRLRAAFLRNCRSDTRKALRAILLGALHGPKQKTLSSYFSNQCTRTYAPKPRYAVKFWAERGLRPDRVDVLKIIERRAHRYFSLLPDSKGIIRLGDSRSQTSLLPGKQRYSWVITSPPYYGMRTYIPDQWLRNWFLGGPDCVDYGNQHQIVHSCPQDYADDLQKVWGNVAEVCKGGAHMVIRFGGISCGKIEPKKLLKESLTKSGWKLKAVRNAGDARRGKRQADSFMKKESVPMTEYDVWAVLA